MTGRGQSARGSSRSHNMPEFMLDNSNRRGRGRPKRFPLSGPLRMPVESDEQVVEEDFTGEEPNEVFQVEEEDRTGIDKIKQIQQQKMIQVTPMAQKRIRGRPPRQSSSSQHPMEEDMVEEEMALAEQIESGPLIEGPSDRKPVQPTLITRGSRVRHAPKRHNDFILTSQKSRVPHDEPETIPPIPVLQTADSDDHIEPLIPNDAHIEDVHSAAPRQELESLDATEERDTITPVVDKVPEESEHRLRGPPPAPPHLANKANGRGRPANPVPPHRRPIPKDLVPPGTSALKRASQMKDPAPPKRRDLTNREKSPLDQASTSQSSRYRDSSALKGPTIHLPRPIPLRMSEEPVAIAQVPVSPSQVPIAIQQVEVKIEPPEAVNEIVISESDGPPPIPSVIQQQAQQHQTTPTQPGLAADIGKKREREAGKDLPSEHFPKEKARHVSIRGLHPFAADKNSMVAYDMRDQVLMHPEDIEEQQRDGVAQQRVLTLQGGSFIEDRIGRADMMEDEEMKLMKNMQPQQYIEVEENGMNVVYEVDPHEVIDPEHVDVELAEETVGQEDQYLMEDHHEMQKQVEMVDDDDDDLPPQLVPEGMSEDVIEDQQPSQQEHEQLQKGAPVDEDGNFDFNMMDEGETIRLHSPGGRPHDVRLTRDVDGNPVFIDENGHAVELVTDTGALVEPSNMGDQEHQDLIVPSRDDMKIKQQSQEGPSGQMDASGDRGNVEFNFLDNNNICCGLCGEIVQYDKLVTEHLPNAHPEFQSPGIELEEVPYENWLKSRLKQEAKIMENGFRHFDDHDGVGFGGSVRLFSKGLRQLRKVSQIRVNVNEMTMSQLEIALKRKLVEKMGRKVPVSLVDRLHARCDICQAVVSLNKKFEVIHLVRHFNAWHPSEHRCSQDWKQQPTVTTTNARRPLSLHDFAVISTDSEQNNLQCIWCGMMMDRAALGMHFTEVHSQQVIVPNCSLCLQEMVMTARLSEKYGDDFGISLPDEFHLQSSKLEAKFSSEKALDKAIDKYLKRSKINQDNEDEEGQDDVEAICTTNSQQSFGRRNRLKRKFVKPCFRQICPTNSEFFEPKSACEWKCKICNRNVYGAVISAGAIKHFKEFHPGDAERMQSELVKARLERIGDGSMEFVHPQLVECLICNLTYALHKPYNICRAIRHLRLKHPEVMPETSGKSISGAEIAETTNLQKPIKKPIIKFGDLITDPIELERFRKDHVGEHFDKVQVVFGIKKNNEPSYVLLMENEKIDMKMAQKMAEENDQSERAENRFDQMVDQDNEQNINDEEDFQNQEENPEESMYPQETKPQMVLDFPEQIVEGEAMEMEELPADGDYIQAYDANNPDHVLIEENEIMNGGNYEMIQEDEYQEIDDDNRHVRYLTEEEIRQAEERGEILEYEEQYIEEEYVEQQ